TSRRAGRNGRLLYEGCNFRLDRHVGMSMAIGFTKLLFEFPTRVIVDIRANDARALCEEGADARKPNPLEAPVMMATLPLSWPVIVISSLSRSGNRMLAVIDLHD